MLKICLVKIEKPIDEKTFRFLLCFSPPEKQARILRQKVKQNADTMAVGGALVRHMIFQEFHIPWEKQIIAYGSHGKPYLRDYPEVHFNISHSGPCVACAVADSPIGIDIQEVVPYDPDTARLVFSEEEIDKIEKSFDMDLAFTRAWTIRESILKAQPQGDYTCVDCKIIASVK